MRTQLCRSALAVATVAGLTALGVGTTAGTATASPPPIKIALITSATGLAAPLFQTSAQGFLARLDLQNAEGGIHGAKLQPIVLNDQTNPTEVATAVQEAIADGAIGIVSDTSLFFSGYKFAQEAGVPVTGGSFDGPEWGEQPNTNMFASDTGSVDPTYPANTNLGQFLKSHGGTVLGTYGIMISPSSVHSAIGVSESFKHAGGKTGVLDTSVPYGGVDFTTEALTARSSHVNAVYAGMGNNQNFALAAAFKDAGVKLKAVVFPTGYEADVVHSPVWKTVVGDYFSTEFHPFALPDFATAAMGSALLKYQHRSPSNWPTFNIYESWLGTDLMIKGLLAAGPNPTRAGVIKALRGVTAYNGGGLLSQNIDYATVFGHDLPEQCAWYLQAQSKGFVPISTGPICGKDIPGSATATAPSS
ncbi:MAG TPA: ABC transporter substrate-binding protein [Acidimicrobiales bacterium]|nr:ABC transporter substrate-binding protein [Acidimicrobiales bacterium]